MNYFNKIVFILLLAGVLGIEADHASAQAFCALRDPVSNIAEQFPSYTHYRSVVRKVGDQHRNGIRKQLNFTIHANELGQHTLYVIFRDDTRLGYLHVRSERGKWGLYEVAWALEPDLRLRDFQLQRCRERSCEYVKQEQFRMRLRGKTEKETRTLLGPQGEMLQGLLSDTPAENTRFVSSLVRSALKTFVSTRLVWSQTLAKAKTTEN